MSDTPRDVSHRAQGVAAWIAGRGGSRGRRGTLHHREDLNGLPAAFCTCCQDQDDVWHLLFKSHVRDHDSLEEQSLRDSPPMCHASVPEECRKYHLLPKGPRRFVKIMWDAGACHSGVHDPLNPLTGHDVTCPHFGHKSLKCTCIGMSEVLSGVPGTSYMPVCSYTFNDYFSPNDAAADLHLTQVKRFRAAIIELGRVLCGHYGAAEVDCNCLNWAAVQKYSNEYLITDY